jgi:hypothetical protein
LQRNAADERFEKAFGFFRQGKCPVMIAPPCGIALPVNSFLSFSFVLRKKT